MLSFGIEILRSCLQQKNFSSKPFGSKGFASLYSITYEMSMMDRFHQPSRDLQLYDYVAHITQKHVTDVFISDIVSKNGFFHIGRVCIKME